MKRKIWIIFGIGLCLMAAQPVFAQVRADIQKYKSCQYCGMDREKFAYSRMLLEYDDASAVGTCSIHCLAVDLALNIDKTPKTSMWETTI